MPLPSTKTVTAFTVTGVRTNVDGSKVLIATVTYSDTTTETVEILPLTVKSS